VGVGQLKLMRTSHPSGSRHQRFPRGRLAAPLAHSSPRKIIGTKPCPIVYATTGFLVLRRNGPDPSWFKA